MLVVISIMALLAGLIVGLAPTATAKMRISRAQAELAGITAAINSYYNKKGVYPPDNTNNPAMNSLFYELTGTTAIITGPNNQNFRSLDQQLLQSGAVPLIFGAGAFVNSSPDPTQIQNFFPGLNLVRQTGSFTASNSVPGRPVYTLLCSQVAGPSDWITADGKKLNPWNYVSSNPTNNTATYDLWIDIVIKGKTTRISNWSP
jgi:type II secretory pathway pseudopilin PulG